MGSWRFFVGRVIVEGVMRYLAFLLLFSCGSLDQNADVRSDYENYLSRHMVRKKLYTEVRETASMSFLEVTPELIQLQSKLAPGFELRPTPEQTLFIVSVEMPEWARFNIIDFKFLWGGTPSKNAREVMDAHLIQNFYPYAVPHDRTFIVEFVKPVVRSKDFVMQTPQGQVRFDVQ